MPFRYTRSPPSQLGLSPTEAKYLGQNGGKLGGNGSSMIFGGARWQRPRGGVCGRGGNGLLLVGVVE